MSVMDHPHGKPRAGFPTAKLVGAACALAGVAILAWLGLLLYRGSPQDQLLLVALGIPLAMLIGWAGLGLVFRGLAWLAERRPRP